MSKDVCYSYEIWRIHTVVQLSYVTRRSVSWAKQSAQIADFLRISFHLVLDKRRQFPTLYPSVLSTLSSTLQSNLVVSGFFLFLFCIYVAGLILTSNRGWQAGRQVRNRIQDTNSRMTLLQVAALAGLLSELCFYNWRATDFSLNLASAWERTGLRFKWKYSISSNCCLFTVVVLLRWG